MATEIATRIAAHKPLTRAGKTANKETVQKKAALHEDKAISALAGLLTDRKAPATAKARAADILLDRIAGKAAKPEDEQRPETELEKKTPAELLQFITEQIAPLPSQARNIIAECAIKGVAFDAMDIEDELAPAEQSQLTELPPLVKPKREKKEPRR